MTVQTLGAKLPKVREQRGGEGPQPAGQANADALIASLQADLAEEPGSDQEQASITEPVVDVSKAEATRQRLFVLLYQSGGTDEAGGTINPDCVYQLRASFADADIQAKPEDVEIDLWLESPGGSAHSAYKLMLLLRSIGHKLRVVIPDYAKSAATLVALGADEIYMAPAAELGPLDAQIEYEEKGIPISALDMARSVEYLAQTALSLVLAGGATVVRTTHLSRRETLSSMLRFASDFLNPIVAKLDPSMVHRASSELRVASEYAHRLMAMRNLDDSDRARIRPDLDERLVEKYPSHGFVISREEARRLGLPVRDGSEYDHWDLAWRVYEAVEQTGNNLLGVYTEKMLGGFDARDGGEK